MINRTFATFCRISIFLLLFTVSLNILAQAKHGKRTIHVMEYNVENLFDCENDSLKDDSDFLPEGSYRWTPSKYWRKLNAVARGIVLASSEKGVFLAPDIVGLCEVENDSVVSSLVSRSLLRTVGYKYVMTNSPDARGVDVALLYQPSSFRLITSYALRVDTVPGMRPTRDILYAKGDVRTTASDGQMMPRPLHVFVVHAPSRRGGERVSRPYRMVVVKRLMQSVDSIRSKEQDAMMLVMGDFNDYGKGASIRYMSENGFDDVSSAPYLTADKDVKGTYRYRGEWSSLDHVFVNNVMSEYFISSFIGKHPDILEEDAKYGGVMPFRFFRGPTVHGGYSDHLPLVVDFCM